MEAYVFIKKRIPLSRRREKFPLIISVLLILTFILLASVKVEAQSVSDKKIQLKKVQAKLRRVKKNILIANKRENDLAIQLGRTHKQIKKLKQDISNLNKDISKSRLQIKKMRQEVAMLRKQLGERQAILARRLREVYLNDNAGIVDVLTRSSDLTDFLARTDNTKRILESDRQLMDAIRREQDIIKSRQCQIDNKYRRMLAYRGKLTQQKYSLASIEFQRRKLLREVERKRKHYLQEKWTLEDHTHELEMQIQNMLREYQENYGAYVEGRGTGSMVFPTSGSITSDYGWRIHPILGYSRFHTGIDIGAGYGTNICAADSGAVIYSGWCGGYGNTLIIDHGKGVSTLYAHCSAIYVSYGQPVSKGQSVAAVGSTGMSTGPHLHFEVRINGTPVSPWGYLR